DRLELREVFLEDREGQVEPAREMAVEHALPDAGVLGDRAERHVVAAVGEQPAGRVEDRLPVGRSGGRTSVDAAAGAGHAGNPSNRTTLSGWPAAEEHRHAR